MKISKDFAFREHKLIRIAQSRILENKLANWAKICKNSKSFCSGKFVRLKDQIWLNLSERSILDITCLRKSVPCCVLWIFALFFVKLGINVRKYQTLWRKGGQLKFFILRWFKFTGLSEMVHWAKNSRPLPWLFCEFLRPNFL